MKDYRLWKVAEKGQAGAFFQNDSPRGTSAEAYTGPGRGVSWSELCKDYGNSEHGN